MISILPLKDADLLGKLNRQAGCKAKHAYCLYEKDRLEGWVLYSLVDRCGQIEAISAPDILSFDGLVRAVYGSLLDFGINQILFSEKVAPEILTKLGFTDKDGISRNISNVICCKDCKL